MFMRNSLFKLPLCVLFVFCISGCATNRSGADSATADEFYDESNDAYETFNRRIFSLNNFLDRWLLKPAAKSYQWLMPSFMDRGISNMFDNVADVPGFLNAGLQGDFAQMGKSTGRVLINSTVGIVGFFDVASDIGLERRQEDFGQTLGVWGVGEGPYVELPFFGGRNLRDAFAMIPDWFLNPLSYIEDPATRSVANAVNIVDTRADLLALESFVAGDRYSFIRDVYRQNREAAIANGNLESADEEGGFDDFGDEDF